MTFERLWQASPAAWQRCAQAWRELASATGRRGAELGADTLSLVGAWSGAGARSAMARLADARDELVAGRLAQLEAGQVLAELAVALAHAKERLAAAVRAAEAAGLTVGPSGRLATGGGASDRVAGMGGGGGPERVAGMGGGGALDRGEGVGAAGVDARLGTAGAVCAAEIETVLAAASAVDVEAAARLAELCRAADSGWEAMPPGYRPGPELSPAAVRAWWEALAPAQRRWLIRHESSSVGGLDGVPVAARDLANRLTLERLLGGSAPDGRADSGGTGVAGGTGVVGGGGLKAAGFGDVSGGVGLSAERRAALERLAEMITADDDPACYLLKVDPAGDGRAIVAVGDPDRSGAVLTYVPGMTSDLASAGGELERARRVAAQAAAIDPTVRTSAVLWLDYDAPDFIDEAAGAGPARDGAPGLDRFQEGLRATHEGEPARRTVLGHSYGSLVVGLAARDHGLAADALMLLASPGAGVGHARELGAAEIWAGTSGTDPIQYLPVSASSVVADVALTALMPGYAVAAYGLPEDDLWHGRNPADPAFGARPLASQADAGHLGYWDPGRPALEALARITLGHPPSGEGG